MAGRFPQPAKEAAAYAYNAFKLAVATIGAKAANVINVAIQLQDARGNNLQAPAVCRVFLSDSVDGHTLTATAATSALAIGTNGTILDTVVSEKFVDILTNASGKFDLNITQTASPVAYYMAIVLPDGSLAMTGVIQF